MDRFRPQTESASDEPAQSHRPHPASRFGRTRGGIVALAVLAGCQSYEPRPLDPAAQREAWHARTLEGGSLREFLEGLEDRAGAAQEFDPSDGLSLQEGQLVALVYNPTLRIARLRAGRAAAGAEQAGRWADPGLESSVLRIKGSVPDPWVISKGLTFSLPLSGRLETERELADAEQRALEGAALEAEWSVWRDVRSAWIEWSAACLRAQETERFVADMQGLVRAASELAERGEIQRTEASLLRVEETQRRTQLRRLNGETDAWAQRLRGLMGLTPTAPVELVPAIALPAADGSAEGNATGPDAIELRNPSLARLRLEYEVAEQTLRHEVRRQYPDLTLGPLFESDEGQSRIGLLFGIPVPFLNANRRAIAEARAEREVARAVVEGTYQVLVSRWAAAMAQAQSLARQREEMVQELVPLVDRQLADALELMRLGEGDTTLVLLASLTRDLEAKLDLIDTRAAEALARTEEKR